MGLESVPSSEAPSQEPGYQGIPHGLQNWRTPRFKVCIRTCPGEPTALTHILLGSQEAGWLPDIVSQQEGTLLQDIQEHGGRVHLLRGIHVFPGLESLWPKQVVHRLYHSLHGFGDTL